MPDCGSPGPGPGAIKLPPLTGFNQHALSHDRKPMYSMAARLKSNADTTPGPGAAAFHPGAYIYTGKEHISGYIGQRLKELSAAAVGPGPAYMLPQLFGADRTRRWLETAPDYSMGQRLDLKHAGIGPGAARYMLPDPFGNVNVYANRAGRYSMAMQLKTRAGEKTPGPADFDTRTQPGHCDVGRSMHRRLYTKLDSKSPGPALYNLQWYRPRTRRPIYSMGIRTARTPMIVPGDNC